MFKQITIFPKKRLEDWIFYVSIADDVSIMVLCYEVGEPENFIIRFFTEEIDAAAFIEEAKMGKHSP